MDKEIIFLVEEDSDGGYTARALGHSIFTEAENLVELKSMIQDDVTCHFGTKSHTPFLRWVFK